jgi:hypothetical protein
MRGGSPAFRKVPRRYRRTACRLARQQPFSYGEHQPRPAEHGDDDGDQIAGVEETSPHRSDTISARLKFRFRLFSSGQRTGSFALQLPAPLPRGGKGLSNARRAYSSGARLALSSKSGLPPLNLVRAVYFGLGRSDLSKIAPGVAEKCGRAKSSPRRFPTGKPK